MKRVYIGGILLGLGLMKFLKIFGLLMLQDMFVLWFGAEHGMTVATLFVVVGTALILHFAIERRLI